MTDKACAECGMTIETPGEYHPFAACLMFKACHDSATVRASLDAIREYERKNLAAGASEGQAEPVAWAILDSVEKKPVMVEFDKSEADQYRDVKPLYFHPSADEYCKAYAEEWQDTLKEQSDCIKARDTEIVALREQIDQSAKIIASLAERIAGMEKDAERLDSGCIVTTDYDEFGDQYVTERRGYDLRAAIDAAIDRAMQDKESGNEQMQTGRMLRDRMRGRVLLLQCRWHAEA